MYKIIIADDEPMVCDLIQRLLVPMEEIKIVAVASDGNEVIQLYHKHRPDMILTDVRMPGMDGLTMLHQLHEISPRVIVIILSAYSNFDYARQALQHGAFEYLLKPVDENALRDTVHRAELFLDSQYREKENLSKIKRELNKLQEELATIHNQNQEELPGIECSPPILMAIQYLHDNFSENITLNRVADHVFLNRTYLSELFKTEVGSGFTKYLTNLRIQKAKTLLLVPSLKINEISHMVGFINASYFMKTFKDITGCTPQEFRSKIIEQRKGGDLL